MAQKNRGIKHDIEKNWNKAINFVPQKDEIIIYEPDMFVDYYRIKIGDGKTSVVDLQFSKEPETNWKTF